MTNEKVFNYVGTSGKPLYSGFFYSGSNIGFCDADSDWGILFTVDYEGRRKGFSYSNNRGFKSGKDQQGKNMITG